MDQLLAFRSPTTLAVALKAAAVAQGMTVSAMVREAIAREMSRLSGEDLSGSGRCDAEPTAQPARH